MWEWTESISATTMHSNPGMKPSKIGYPFIPSLKQRALVVCANDAAACPVPHTGMPRPGALRCNGNCALEEDYIDVRTGVSVHATVTCSAVAVVACCCNNTDSSLCSTWLHASASAVPQYHLHNSHGSALSVVRRCEKCSSHHSHTIAFDLSACSPPSSLQCTPDSCYHHVTSACSHPFWTLVQPAAVHTL